MIGLTGNRSPSLDLAACTAHGVVVCNTGGTASSQGTAELALMLAAAAGAGDEPGGHCAIRVAA